jgi:hypothetical protein
MIAELIEENNCTVLNTGTGTYIKQDGSMSHLDVTIATNNLAAKSNWTVYDESWGSDHLPIIKTMNEPPQYEETMSEKWLFKKADWINFKIKCETEITEKLISSNADDSTEKITNAILEAARANIPVCKPHNVTKQKIS